MKAAAYRVHGRVQGVGFRWWTRSQATRLGLAGTVRNLDDGAVEVHLHGAEQAVETMTGLLRRGPPGAEVERLEEVPVAEAEGQEFRIVR